MTMWWLVAIGGLAVAAGVITWLVLQLHSRAPHPSLSQRVDPPLEAAMDKDVEHIFNNDFREELRNRGRLHFEKIIGENAMFLQQDLRLTTSQLNEYMKTEITRKLQEEFAKYEQSITDAKQLAVDSIAKTNAVVEEQRTTLLAQLAKEVPDQKARLITHFENDMADLVNNYVLAAIG